MEATAARQLIYLIVPFAYEHKYEGIRRNLDASGLWSRHAGESIEHVFEHIKLLGSDSDAYAEAIGQRYVLTAEGRYEAGWPRNADTSFRFREKGSADDSQEDTAEDSFVFAIPEVQLLLFETQVGFLVYKVDYGVRSDRGGKGKRDGGGENSGKLTVDQIIAHTYGLKSFSRRYGTISYKARPMQSMIELMAGQGFDPHGVKLTMKYGMTADGLIREWSERRPELDFSAVDMVALRQRETATEVVWDFAGTTRRLVERLAPATFFENTVREGVPYPANALVFSAITADASCRGWEPEMDRPLKHYLFQMRRCFKSSYRPAEQEFHWNGHTEIYQAFENSWWGASLEGAANLTYLLGNRQTGLAEGISASDEKTNRFLQGNYYGNLEGSYFYLYVLALHQRYALLHITRQASRLPKMLSAYLDEESGEEASRKLRELQEQIVLFTLRCSYKHVSGVTHQAKVYELMRDTLKIELLLQELHFEMEAISSIMELRKQEQRQRQERLEAERWKQEERRREREERKSKLDDDYSKRFETLIILLTTLFVAVSTLNDGWGFIEAIGKQYGLPDSRLYGIFNIGIVVTLMLIGTGFGYYVFARIRKRRRLQLMDDEDE